MVYWTIHEQVLQQSLLTLVCQQATTRFRQLQFSHIGGSSAFSAVRYNADGSLDSTFDTDGKITTSFGLNAAANGLASLPGSRFALAGTVHSVSGAEGDFGVARYNSDGSLDTAFNGDGRRVDDSDLFAKANAVAIQPDQKIVVAGSCAEDTNSIFAIARYNENGTLDTSFDGDGRVTTSIGDGASAQAVVVQPDGKILAVGSTADGASARFALARYSQNGSLDQSFGLSGKVITPATTRENATGVALQPDQKIVVVGTISITATNAIFGVARYNAK